ncbi:MAG: ATP-binding protein [Victivallales bacterium]
MIYKKRHIEGKLKEYSKYFKVILVTGARQVGKSTLLKHVFPELKTVVFDPLQDIYGARKDPDLFLDNFPSPVILDEIQYAPELLPAIKRRVDLSEKKGLYFLTGSQNLGMLKSVSESLAGRVGILNLEGMTIQEMTGQGAKPTWLELYLKNPASLPENIKMLKDSLPPLKNFLWRGSFPGILEMPDNMIHPFYESYLMTYVERDVRLLENIRDMNEFAHFFRLCSALSSQEINMSQLGREVGISPLTAAKWTFLLENSYQYMLLPAYHGNIVKRLSQKKKGCLRDTGFICYLQGLASPDMLAGSALMGSVFETWAVNSVFRQAASLGFSPMLYHWRTNGGAEVDLVIEANGKLYPVEVKCKTNLKAHDTSGIKAFFESYRNMNVEKGLIIYAGDMCYRLEENIIAIPWNAVAG